MSKSADGMAICPKVQMEWQYVQKCRWNGNMSKSADEMAICPKGADGMADSVDPDQTAI